MKFFIALVFALAMCSFASAQGFDGGWITIQYDPHNATLTNYYDFGREMAQLQAIETGEDPNGDWTFLQVNSLEFIIENGNYYRFNVEISQGTQGNTTLIFVVNDSPLHLVSWQLD